MTQSINLTVNELELVFDCVFFAVVIIAVRIDYLHQFLSVLLELLQLLLMHPSLASLRLDSLVLFQISRLQMRIVFPLVLLPQHLLNRIGHVTVGVWHVVNVVVPRLRRADDLV